MEKGPNFHEISEERKELKRAISELSTSDRENSGGLKDKLFKKPLAEVESKAKGFKVADFGGMKGAKEALKKQKEEYEERSESLQNIDYETIEEETPEIKDALDAVESVADLRDFRMKRMMEMQNPTISPVKRKMNEGLIQTVKKEITEKEKAIEQTDPIVLRQAEIVKYKEDLAKTGHICITPSVEKDLEAVGDRMLTGKPMFLHGPTGTGKTSLARFAAIHFTGKDPEMVFCNQQTRESNVWGKTGIRPAGGGGAIETVEIHGPLAKAMTEGKAVIFDEFTALPKEQMVFIKGVFNAKVGDKINIVGNGIVEIKPGFQMIFTANLKSEKNPERQDLPPEIAREFEQNNLEVKYIPQDEAYDVMISRLTNRDGSLDLSYHDLNTTLPNLCRVMSEIQESYTNVTDEEVARRVGAMDASKKVSSLKKFVMTQGSVEAILSAWAVEKQKGEKGRTFSEFLDERFKTALTFKEYPKEDRILAAKILASRGFLLTLSAKDLDLPEDVFKLNTIKSIRGEDAVEDLKDKSGDVRHLTLKEVALLDPFNKRAELLKNRADALLNAGGAEVDPFLSSVSGRLNVLLGKSGIKPEISADYKNLDGKIEKITIDIEKKITEFLDFYKRHNISLPPHFDDMIRTIWSVNQYEIKKAIETAGFDEVLIVGNTRLSELKDKIQIGKGYSLSDSFEKNGSFGGAESGIYVDQPRIILVHKTQNIVDHPIQHATLNTKGNEVIMSEVLTLEDYIVFQAKYFEMTGKHLDEKGQTWLATTIDMKGNRGMISAGWKPQDNKLDIVARDPDFGRPTLGVRGSKKFF